MPLALSDTLAALLAPRRAVPIAVLAGVLLAAQASTSADVPHATLGGIVAVVGFVTTAPHLWRCWRPLDPARSGTPWAGLALAVCAASPVVVGTLIPRGDATLFTAGMNGLVVGALYWVGGWGLARDIELEARAEALAHHAEHAELLAIKAHLDPHFLFNTLNAIAAWCGEDPAQAEAALLRLADVLREVFTGVGAATWPLARELALAKDVCALHAVRDPERYAVDWAADDPPAVDVPPLLLLPIVENAFTHGPGAGHAGRVRVGLTREGGDVVIVVRNPGPYGGPRDGGEGLRLLARRASLAGGSFSIVAVADGTEARVRLPCHPPGGNPGHARPAR